MPSLISLLPSPRLQGCSTPRYCRPVRVLCATSVPKSSSTEARQGIVEPGALVLVAGATGGVGQLVTAKLLERGYKVRALTRSEESSQRLCTTSDLCDAGNIELVFGDLREPGKLQDYTEGVDAVCCCTGTTAFPSKRWQGDNGPKETDYLGVKNLISACPKTLGRFVLVSSAGVERPNQFPYIVLNLFGVLKYKKMGEEFLEASGLPYTILRPGRLTDGPYTSYDLNTLIKATSGTKRDVQISPKEELNGETSRIAVAEGIVQSLQLPNTVGKKFSLTSTEGEGPGQDKERWEALFAST